MGKKWEKNWSMGPSPKNAGGFMKTAASSPSVKQPIGFVYLSVLATPFLGHQSLAHVHSIIG